MLGWGMNRDNPSSATTLGTLEKIAPSPKPQLPPNRIALALGGGAARGWAHIGVLGRLTKPE